jgi:hypothetical protein
MMERNFTPGTIVVPTALIGEAHEESKRTRFLGLNGIVLATVSDSDNVFVLFLPEEYNEKIDDFFYSGVRSEEAVVTKADVVVFSELELDFP